MTDYTATQTQINKREALRCERDCVGGRSIVRIQRFKPKADGTMRAAGPHIEFADRHLPSVIAMLQDLQDQFARKPQAVFDPRTIVSFMGGDVTGRDSALVPGRGHSVSPENANAFLDGVATHLQEG